MPMYSGEIETVRLVLTVTLTSLPGAVPGAVHRLKRLLKILGRGLGFQCREIVAVPPAPPPASPDTPKETHPCPDAPTP